MDTDWRKDLEHWLEPFVKGLGNKTPRRMCPACIAGLIGPGDRKSIQPLAARFNAISYDRLHHFIGASVWGSAPLEATLWQQADDLIGGEQAWLIIDDTALPQKGNASVGVAPQYASISDKNANCQSLASVTLASWKVPLMLSLRLFLPESWTSEEAGMITAGVPEQFRQAMTKPELAVKELTGWQRPGRASVVSWPMQDMVSAPFRQALTARGLYWAVGIPRHQKVYPADVQLTFPEAGRGRPRLRHVPDVKSVAAHAILEGSKWRCVSWRRGTKDRLFARFAAMLVRIAGSAAAYWLCGRAAHARRGSLAGERTSFERERKYYLSNLPSDTPIRDVAGAIKARWICEQAHQQLKEELGLDHFEGRSWTGLHRYALITMMAYTFLPTRRLAQAGRKKESPDLPLNLPAVRQAIINWLPYRHRPDAPDAVARCLRPKLHFCQSRANRSDNGADELNSLKCQLGYRWT